VTGGHWVRKIIYARVDVRKLGPFPSQQRFHDLPNRYKGFSGAINSGKSLALCHEALKLAYANPGCMGLIGAPTYPMLRDSTRTAFFEILEENQVPHRFLKAENKLWLPEPRASVLFRSLDNPERLRGPNLAWVAVDELTYCKEAAWLRLEGRLRAKKARHLCGIASWTPKGFDWVYQRFIGPEKLAGYDSVRAVPFENADPEFYERLKISYAEKFYRQEALGEYLSIFSGQAYYGFDRSANVRNVVYSPRYPLIWTIDFNCNPHCSVLAQSNGTTVHVIDELILPDSNTPAACEEFLERTRKWIMGLEFVQRPTDDLDSEAEEIVMQALPSGPMNVYVYGDATGSSRKTSASRTDWQIVKEFFGRYTDRFKVQFRVPSANPPQKDRVNCVNARLCNYAGDRRVLIALKCKELAKDFEQVGWKTDAKGNALAELDKSDGLRTHVSDALGYMIAKEFPMRGVRGEQGGPSIV
jgi:terminase large subunit-like protein